MRLYYSYVITIGRQSAIKTLISYNYAVNSIIDNKCTTSTDTE